MENNDPHTIPDPKPNERVCLAVYEIPYNPNHREKSCYWCVFELKKQDCETTVCHKNKETHEKRLSGEKVDCITFIGRLGWG